MTDPRTPLFDAVKPYLPKGYDPAIIAALHAFADVAGIAKKPASPKPTGVALPGDYWPLPAKIESAGRPYVKAATSSGSGLYQFLKATWIGEGGAWGGNPAQAFGGLKPSEEEQTARAKTFTVKNAVSLMIALSISTSLIKSTTLAYVTAAPFVPIATTFVELLPMIPVGSLEPPPSIATSSILRANVLTISLRRSCSTDGSD